MLDEYPFQVFGVKFLYGYYYGIREDIMQIQQAETKKAIEQYIRNQLQEDTSANQMNIKEYIDTFMGMPVGESK